MWPYTRELDPVVPCLCQALGAHRLRAAVLWAVLDEQLLRFGGRRHAQGRGPVPGRGRPCLSYASCTPAWGKGGTAGSACFGRRRPRLGGISADGGAAARLPTKSHLTPGFPEKGTGCVTVGIEGTRRWSGWDPLARRALGLPRPWGPAWGTPARTDGGCVRAHEEPRPHTAGVPRHPPQHTRYLRAVSGQGGLVGVSQAATPCGYTPKAGADTLDTPRQCRRPA